MANAKASFNAQMEALRENYQLALPARVNQVRQLWTAFRDNPKGDMDVAELLRAVHSLAGSGATFGFSGISDTARSLEELLHSADRQAVDLCADTIDRFDALLDRLEQEATRQAPPPPDCDPAPPTLESKVARREIFLVENDTVEAREIAMEIAHSGYSVTLFPTLDKLGDSLARRRPGAIVMDMAILNAQSTPLEMIAGISKIGNPPTPVVVLSRKNDFESRLQAVRAGAAAYFPKPVEISLLVEELDKLTGHEEQAPYRILIIEDDPPMAVYFASVLEAAGMIVETLFDPMAAMERIIDFSPELILTDLYMPGCSGIELAQVIRQQSAYAAIPLVFLSSENREEKQFSAIAKGGDAFLTKPVSDKQLISAVTSRVERSRLIRSLMVRDSLTGLLNHSYIKDHLSIEVNRISRTGGKFTFVMIDIDLFKHVNDTYGHPTGDRVIKSLSQMLTRRLRKSDMIGRYGGEEFAVILVNTDQHKARDIMNGIRLDFAARTHNNGDKQFTVTFSCGIAECPAFATDELLNDAADKALYEAKHAGRNCVVLASKTI